MDRNGGRVGHTDSTFPSPRQSQITFQFAHPVSPESKTRNRETCTSTGIRLNQVQSSLPQAMNFERYAIRRAQQESREFPFSGHDNKHSLKDSVSVFSHGVGRRKYFDNRRQHISHFCLRHDEASNSTEKTRRNVTAYQTDFQEKLPAVNGPSHMRRFPKDHQQKSTESALAQAGEKFMWFGRHDSALPETLHSLAGNTNSVLSKP